MFHLFLKEGVASRIDEIYWNQNWKEKLFQFNFGHSRTNETLRSILTFLFDQRRRVAPPPFPCLTIMTNYF